jgi:hypothetical protein
MWNEPSMKWRCEMCTIKNKTLKGNKLISRNKMEIVENKMLNECQEIKKLKHDKQ